MPHAQRDIVAETIGTTVAYPTKVALKVLTTKALFDDWQQELKEIAERMHHVRQSLADNLKNIGTPGTWDHIVNQAGLFTYLGLSRNLPWTMM
jgi:aspartate aminotransferase